MGNRRNSREIALQLLFGMDIRKAFKKSLEDEIEWYCTNYTPPKKALPFFRVLVEGVMKAREELDGLLERFSSNWKINRMSCVDRNIMRIAVFEMLYLDDIPPKVSINEAIDIGKRYGTEDSGSFINGILDSIFIAIDKKEISGRADNLKMSVSPDGM